jgi:hypothetical protein
MGSGSVAIDKERDAPAKGAQREARRRFRRIERQGDPSSQN